MPGSRPMVLRICLSNTSFVFLFFLFSLTQGHTQSTNKLTDALFEQFYACIEKPYSQKTENELSKIKSGLEKIPSATLDAADLWHEIGLYYYGDLGAYEQALACFVAAQAIRKKIIHDPAHNDLARSAFMIGVCHKYLGNYDKAAKQVHSALAVSQKGQNHFMLAKEYLELGDIFDFLGDFDHSINCYERAYPHILKSTRDRASLLEDHFKRQAQAYLAKEKHHLALEKNRQAIKVCLDSIRPDLADRFHAEIADCYTNMNISFRAANQYDSAYWCLQQALKYYQKSNLVDIALNIGNVYNELGDLYMAKKQYATAIQNQQKAIKILHAYPKHRYLTFAYTSLGEAYLQSGEPEPALGFFRKALRILVPHFPASVRSIGTVSDRSLIALHGIARCQLAQQKLTHAFNNFRRLDTLVSQLRFSLREDGSKFSLAKQALPIYENAIYTALLLGDTIAALDFCERNKAIVLRQALVDQQAKHSVGIPAQHLKKEATLRSRLLYWQKKVIEASDEVQRGIWQDSSAQAKAHFERFVRFLEKQHPQYHDLKYAQVRAPSIAAVQQSLPDSSLCLEYFFGQEQLFLFAWSKEECRVFFQQVTPAFSDSLSALIHLLRQPTPDAPTLRKVASLSYLAYQTLIAPAALTFNQQGQIRRLRIIPDGLLHYLPFDVLLEAPSDDLKSNQAAYLIKKYAISYGISNQTIKNGRQARANFAFGGFGITYAGIDTRLAQLPLAEKQVLALQKMMGGRVWVHSEAAADKQVFMRQAPQCQILHLSMHGLINEQEPAKSALVFAKGKQIQPLSALEIYNLHFKNNELTVLGACNTGNGQLQQGEGVMSLSRAFTYAGCKSLVMSLWSLEDVYADELIQGFYRELKKGRPKDIALQQAKLQYLALEGSERRAPNYWGALVLSGALEPLKAGAQDWVLYLVGLLLILIGLGALFFRAKIKKLFQAQGH